MKLGFIGTGNMANAIIGGVIKKNLFTPEDIIGSDTFEGSRKKVKDAYGIEVTADNKDVVKKADIIFLAIKPQFYEDAIVEIKDFIRDEQIVITIAPGKTLSWLEEKFGKKVKLVRTMPNTPAMVLEGMTAACVNKEINEKDMEQVLNVLNSFGKVEVVSERLMNIVVAVSGSSPAYVYILIEAMADAAVAGGMPRAQAYKFAAQSVYGSAKMVMETGKHPGELKDMVCSPGGTTIGAVRILEKEGFRSAIIEAMKECAEIAERL